MSDSIPEEEKSKRLQILMEHQREIQRANYEKHTGQVLETKVEGMSPARGQVVGRTSQNKTLNFTIPAGAAKPKVGSYALVRVVRAHPNSLVGEMVCTGEAQDAPAAYSVI